MDDRFIKLWSMLNMLNILHRLEVFEEHERMACVQSIMMLKKALDELKIKEYVRHEFAPAK